MRWIATLLVAWTVCAPNAWGQGMMGGMMPNGLLPAISGGASTSLVAAPLYAASANPPQRAPLARLVENPDQTDGAPPYALADREGTIQRYVEPVPGIDLAPYVGRVISVRHDTGNTLLATQLDLPPQAFRGGANSDDGEAMRPPRPFRREKEASSEIEQVQYVENDDCSVQLLPDDGSMMGSDDGSSGMLAPLDGMPPGGSMSGYMSGEGYPGYAGMGPQPMYGVGSAMPMGYANQGYPNQGYPNQMMPCPNCGQYHNAIGYGPDGSYCPELSDGPPDRPHLSADVDFMLLRPQVTETAIGKLSEQYEFSPRIILDLRGVGNLEGRVRFWHYDRPSDVLGSNEEVRFRFNVLDIEAVHRFSGGRSDLDLSAGLRLAGMHLTDTGGNGSGADLIGLTVAGDGLTPLGLFPGGHLGLVYGGRFSILGGNWGGADNSLILNHQVRNDNVLAEELYAGVELARRFRTCEIRMRALYEMQNWRSDALSENANLDSIGFFGPGLQLGVDF